MIIGSEVISKNWGEYRASLLQIINIVLYLHQVVSFMKVEPLKKLGGFFYLMLFKLQP